LTVDGEKISKSGRSVEVGPIVERLGADALRWYFVRRCRTRSDADVDTGAIAAAYDADLADGLGNLVQRSTALAVRLGAGRIGAPATESAEAARLRGLAGALPARVDAALDAFLLDDAVAAITELIGAANRALEIAAPWRVARTDPAAAAAALYAPLEAARIAAGELAPFVPGVARTILDRLGDPHGDPRWGARSAIELHAGPPPLPRKRVT
ncbi:MAG TPA: class I tRNA ligase family protein, partial [Kofleriaceae bacterium]|nr:class I tRNA ligase family protein [Kofleriaceae bacterium]